MPIGIRNLRPDQQASCRGFDAVVEGLDETVAGKGWGIRNAQADGQASGGIGGQLAGCLQRLESLDGGFVDVGIDMHRVVGDDGGEQGGEAVHAGDVVAGCDERAGDPARDGTADLGVLEVEAGGGEVGFGGGDGGAGLGETGATLISFLCGDCLLFQQRCGAAVIPLGALGPRLGLGHISLRPLQRSREGAWVDQEKDVPLVHLLTCLEPDLGEIPRHTRSDLDRLDGFDPGAQVHFLGVFTFERRGDGHRGRWRQGRILRLGLPAAVGSDDEGRQQWNRGQQVSRGHASGGRGGQAAKATAEMVRIRCWRIHQAWASASFSRASSGNQRAGTPVISARAAASLRARLT